MKVELSPSDSRLRAQTAFGEAAPQELSPQGADSYPMRLRLRTETFGEAVNQDFSYAHHLPTTAPEMRNRFRTESMVGMPVSPWGGIGGLPPDMEAACMKLSLSVPPHLVSPDSPASSLSTASPTGPSPTGPSPRRPPSALAADGLSALVAASLGGMQLPIELPEMAFSLAEQQQLQQQQARAGNFMDQFSGSVWPNFLTQAQQLQAQQLQMRSLAAKATPTAGAPRAQAASPKLSAAPPPESKVKASPLAGPLTTVMLRGLPEGLSRDSLLDMLDRGGFCGKYDFAYLPVNFDTMISLSHAFVNLVSVQEAERFHQQFEGFSAWPAASEAVCHVVWNDKHQGLADLVERYRNSPVMHESVPDLCQPILMKGGMRAQFPKPTQKTKPPKALKVKAKLGSP